MSVTVSEILIAARSGHAAVSSETAGYLVLGAADCLGEGPLGITCVYLDEDGSLRLDRRSDARAVDSEAGLRTVLKRLLETGRSPAPALMRVAGAQEKRGIRRLITEIEAALIPLNRAAGRRALARLERDVSRAKVAGKLAGELPDFLEAERSAPLPPRVEAKPALPRAVEPEPVEVVEVLSSRPPPPEVLPIAVVAKVHAPEEPSVVARGAVLGEASTPVVPGVDAVPVIPVVGPLATAAPLAPVAMTPAIPDVVAVPVPFVPVVAQPEPAPWTDLEPEATPFLGSIAAVVTRPPEPIATVPEDAEPDTDPAPPVHFDELPEPPRLGETAILGTYGLSRTAVPPDVVHVEAWVEPSVEAEPDDVEAEPYDVEEFLDAEALPLEEIVDVELPSIADLVAAPEHRFLSEVPPRQALELEPPESDVWTPLAPMIASAVSYVHEVSVDAAPEVSPNIEALYEEVLARNDVPVDGEIDGLEAALLDLGSPESDSVPGGVAEGAPQQTESAAVNRPFEPMFEFLHEASALPPVVEQDAEMSVERAAELAITVPAEAVEQEAELAVALPEAVEQEAELAVALPEAVAQEAEQSAAPPEAESLPEGVLLPFAPVFSDFGPVAAESMTVPGLGMRVAPIAPQSSTDDPPLELTPSSPALPEVALAATEADPYRPRRSEVADLVAAFVVAESRSLTELSRELKRLAGIRGTPGPPGVAPGSRK